MKWRRCSRVLHCGGGGMYREIMELRRWLIFALRINKVSA